MRNSEFDISVPLIFNLGFSYLGPAPLTVKFATGEGLIQSLTDTGVTRITGGTKLKTGQYPGTISTLIAPTELRTLTQIMVYQIDRLSLIFSASLKMVEEYTYPISKRGKLKTQAALLNISLFLIRRNNSTLITKGSSYMM